MFDFRYCALCGGALREMLLDTEDRPRLVCLGCGHIHYINPKVVSGTLPVLDGRVWLLRRAIEPRTGYWTHPAGYQEWGETTEEAALRETYEELGCEVRIRGLLGVYSRAAAPVVNIVYLAELIRPELVPESTKEALEIRAFTASDLPWADLAFQSTAHALRDWLARPTLGSVPPDSPP